jgi:NhaP-type Na+/H+ or K+/H+ antiporter
MPTLDTRDLLYLLMGVALLGLSLQPALKRLRLMNIPLLYVAVGALAAAAGLPWLDPLAGGPSTQIVEHIAELIVIISLAGAGLAIDQKMGWRSWQPTWRLLGIAMPITIVALAVLGVTVLGLSVAAAVLLAAVLAPTDPVLARSVQVGPPGEDDEQSLKIALTAEAGLNDGLAFPFVWLAILLAGVGWASQVPAEVGDDWSWLWPWLWRDVGYRVAAGVIIGCLCGHGISRLVYSRFGDARFGARNATLTVLASTLLTYGLTEAVDGYGFLAVFLCARTGRERAQNQGNPAYERAVHHGADQMESILLAILLLWLGAFIVGGGDGGLWRQWTWADLGVALTLLLIVRPIGAYLALIGIGCPRGERWTIAFFGIRGMGSVFYIAYGQTHADFGQIDVVWRVVTLTILLSIVIHGFAANFVLQGEDLELEPPDDPEQHHAADQEPLDG